MVSREHLRSTAFSPSGSPWARRGGVKVSCHIFQHDAELALPLPLAGETVRSQLLLLGTRGSRQPAQHADSGLPQAQSLYGGSFART